MEQVPFEHSYLVAIEDIEPDEEHIPEQLEDIKEAIKFLAETARNILPEGIIKQRAEAYWFSHIVTALDDDNEFIGNRVCQMCDTIYAVYTEWDQDIKATESAFITALYIAVDPLDITQDRMRIFGDALAKSMITIGEENSLAN